MLTPELRTEIDHWLADDPDPDTRAELTRLAAAGGPEVAALFDGRIRFGTAGLRAKMGPGPTRMNRLVVRQTTLGLMRWLSPGATVVIGYDARHNSATFAADVATVVAAVGGQAELLPEPLPTPVLARAVLDRNADAGVMITASHNPATDNGYKLYLADGIQLTSPSDAEIAREIEKAATDPGLSLQHGLGLSLQHGQGPAARHIEASVAACVTSHRSVRVLYTPLHGVGGRHLLAAFEAAGFPPPLVVADQFEPDPDFSTVPYPNPEEDGALDRAIAAAESAGVDVVLANDPDGDRLAVAIPALVGSDRSDRWVRLSGDEVGILLADHLIRHTAGDDRLVASSIVSSRLISALAEAEGVESVRTLTGFKWLARPIVDRPDRRYLLGYEEALGYCVGDRVRDKDGISAALVVAELVAELLAGGQTLWDRLDELARRFGVYQTAPVTLRFDGVDGLAKRAAVMARATASSPSQLAGIPVTDVEDLSGGTHLPPTSGIVWDLDDHSRVLVRPSGTEPKLKAYLEVIEPVTGAGPTTARVSAALRLAKLQTAVSQFLVTPG